MSATSVTLRVSLVFSNRSSNPEPDFSGSRTQIEQEFSSLFPNFCNLYFTELWKISYIAKVWEKWKKEPVQLMFKIHFFSGWVSGSTQNSSLTRYFTHSSEIRVFAKVFDPQNAPKFAIFLWKENTKLLFPLFISYYLIFSPNKCPGLMST